jgi:hypothetical protein
MVDSGADENDEGGKWRPAALWIEGGRPKEGKGKAGREWKGWQYQALLMREIFPPAALSLSKWREVDEW